MRAESTFNNYDEARDYARAMEEQNALADPTITAERHPSNPTTIYTVSYNPPPGGVKDGTVTPPPTAPAELEFSPGFPITRFEFFAAMAHVSLRQIFGGPGKIPSKRVADMAFDDARAMEILAEAERPIQGPPEMAQPEPEE